MRWAKGEIMGPHCLLLSRAQNSCPFYLWTLFLSILIGPLTAQAQHSYERPPEIGRYQLQIDPITQKVNLGINGKTPKLTYESIKQANPQNLEELLRFFQNTTPEVFDQAVVIHTSGSLQPSTPREPRILMYADNVTLSFTLTQKQHTSVEFLQFNNQSLDYSMHEIVFRDDGVVDFNDRPMECLSCHGVNPKPVWEGYDFWPSAVGSHTGRPLSAAEEDLARWVKGEDHQNPVLDKINKDMLKESIDTFSAFLGQQNFLRATKAIEHELKPTGRLYPFRYAVVGLLSCTEKGLSASLENNIIFKDFLPQSVRNQWRVSFDEVYYDVVESNQRVKDDLWEYYLRTFPGSTPPSPPISLNRLRVNEIVQGSQLGYIFANLGLNLRDYTLSFREDSYIMSTPNIFDLELQKTFLYFWPEMLNELDFTVKKVVGSEAEYYDFDCEQLKQKSLATLEGQVVYQESYLNSSERPQAGMAPYGMCVHCHSRKARPGGMQPPYIPFENTWELGRQLRTTDLMQKIRDRIHRADIKQMPKDLPHLTPLQKQSFMQVMRKIEFGTRP